MCSNGEVNKTSLAFFCYMTHPELGLVFGGLFSVCLVFFFKNNKRGEKY